MINNTAAGDSRTAGKSRDAAILRAVEQCKFISRDQVQALVFGHSYRQKCCDRLLRLYKSKRLKRKRVDVAESFVYFLPGEKWNQKAEHYLAVNWVYISLLKQIKSWFKLQAFTREYTATWGERRLVADALVVLANKTTKELKPLFVELDRGTSNNEFDKVALYSGLYDSKAWVASWWSRPNADGRHRFPKVLVVTDRKEKVQEAIDRDNAARDKAARVRFSVATLEDVRKDVYRFI